MEYTIESKKGMQGEPLLSVLIPEDQIDEKALYTMESDQPDFLVPFHYRYIDGNVEFIYTPQKRLKLLFFAGARSQDDYIVFWKKLISPLERCEDWFMRTDGFVLDLQYVYYDKDANEICYLYIPVRQTLQDPADIRQFLQKTASQFTTDNSDLTVCVLGYLLQEGAVQPEDFLQMLAPYAGRKTKPAQTAASSAAQAAYVQQSTPAASVHQPVSAPHPEQEPAAKQQNVPSAIKTPNSHLDDDFNDLKWGEEESSNNTREKKPKKEKPPKKPKEKKSFLSILGKKEPKEPSQPLHGGAQLGDMPLYTPSSPDPQPTPAPSAQPVWYVEQQDDGVTQLNTHETQLRYIGNLNHPAVIQLRVPDNGYFRIGRYDVSVGKQQFDFEFPPDTPAVSRRHAAIGRRGDIYYLADLGSRAGTFVNERKLNPNEEQPLSAGDRISFGNAGANYIFEP